MSSNHGGICVFFRSDIRIKPISLPDYKTFEILALSINSNLLKTALLTIYRPGSAAITNSFFDEFEDVLERCSSFAGCVIVGDINIHLDCSSDHRCQQFQSLMSIYGLTDCVQQPTHIMHHQLDVFLTRSNELQPDVRVDPPLLSDHSLLSATYSFNSRVTPKSRPLIQRRKWRSFKLEDFVTDLLASELFSVRQDIDVESFFKCYDQTLSSLINKHAPVVTVKQYSRPSSPWFDTECHLQKVKTRRLEKIYRLNPEPMTEAAWRSQFSHQRILFQSKMNNYWKTAIESSSGNNKTLWTKLRCLLDAPSSDDSSTSKYSANDFANYFVSKIDTIRQTTSSAPAPVINCRILPDQLKIFRPTTSAEIHSLIAKSAPKQCSLDPIPTWLLKQINGIMSPVIAAMCNSSFKQNTMPQSHKTAIVHPLIKKASLDPSELSSFRPISNLSFVSKILERLVDNRLTEHINKHSLLPPTQSAYRTNHSTETALARVQNDIITAIDHGDVGALVLLDLSAAFDTVDHPILFDILHDRFGVEGDALNWIQSYLTDRSQIVKFGSSDSCALPVTCGVPQGSVLGPRQFISYIEEMASIFTRHDVNLHGFADDMQGLISSSPSQIAAATATLTETITDVEINCSSRRLQLNPKKTELIWFGSACSLRKLSPSDISLNLNGTIIHPADTVRDLGAYFDSEMTMRNHVSRLTRSCFYHLRRLRSIRRNLDRSVTQQLVSAFILSRLDYCNVLLADLPAATIAPLQRVQNAAARLVLDLKPYDHITHALFTLHWLPIKFRIIYKLCLLVHKSLNNRSPTYLTELFQKISTIPSKTSLRSSSTQDLVIPRTNTRIGDRAFSVAGARCWNNLPDDLRCISDGIAFKTRLKTHLFKIAFNIAN